MDVRGYTTEDGQKFYTLRVVDRSIRYYQGRKYRVTTDLVHYVFPRNAKRNFSSIWRGVDMMSPRRTGFIASKSVSRFS